MNDKVSHWFGSIEVRHWGGQVGERGEPLRVRNPLKSVIHTLQKEFLKYDVFGDDLNQPRARGRAKCSRRSFYKANRRLQPGIGIVQMMSSGREIMINWWQFHFNHYVLNMKMIEEIKSNLSISTPPVVPASMVPPSPSHSPTSKPLCWFRKLAKNGGLTSQ